MDDRELSKLREIGVHVARTLPPEAKHSLLRGGTRSLRETPGYGDHLLDLPITGDWGDYGSERVVDELRRLPRTEVERVAERMVEVGRLVAQHRPLAVQPLLELLNWSGCPSEAGRLARAAVEECGSEQSRKPQRLQLALYSKALEIEEALGSRSSELEQLVEEFAAHDSLARPLEVSYGVRVVSDSQDGEVEPSLVVKGQRRLLLRCLDQKQPWYGNAAIEEAVSVIRRRGREVGLQDEELATLLTLSGGMGLVAFEGLSSDVFSGEWTEAEFQQSVRTFLRANSAIGSNLEEHPHAGGGITDLSLNRVRLELKVDPKNLSIDDAVESYGRQAAQYAVGSDRRSAVLAVLCPTKKGSAPAPLQNDIAPRVIAPPTGGSRPVLVAVVLVRRDLQKPSALSR